MLRRFLLRIFSAISAHSAVKICSLGSNKKIGLPRFRSGLQKLKHQIFLRQLQPFQVPQHRNRDFVVMEKRICHFAYFFTGN